MNSLIYKPLFIFTVSALLISCAQNPNAPNSKGTAADKAPSTQASDVLPAVIRGTEGVGGGNAVVCYNSTAKQSSNAPNAKSKSKERSVDLFDYWEQYRDLGKKFEIEMGSKNSSVAEHISYVLNRLSKFDANRVNLYLERAQDVLANLDAYLARDIRLSKLEDYNPRALPEGKCKIERFAVQSIDPKPYQAKFLIDKELYESKATTNRARAGIILHEIIYAEAIRIGQKTSDQTRYFNFLISSDFLNSATQQQYDEVVAVINQAL